jgi:adenosylmethionine-8-amino-7-oxononanoate transaminase
MKRNILAIKDKKYLWHPFTQMKDWLKDDILIIERARGNYLYDTSGRRYLDGISSLWCNIHGHQVKELDSAIKKQLTRVAHSTMLGLSNVPAITLAEELIKIAPEGLTRVFYSDNGSTAVEIALKMTFQYWQQKSPKQPKTLFLSFINSYHGDTIGGVSLGGIDLFHSVYKPLLFNTIQAPAPYCYRCEDKKSCTADKRPCLTKTSTLIKKHHTKLCAVVIEPLIQCAAGMLTQPKGFISTIRDLCTQYNVLMIADEVATGFGRTGKLFACNYENVTPDILCLAKALSGGYLPLAATLTTEKVFNGFLGEYKERKTFFHGHTYTGNPLACAVALSNLRLFKKQKTIAKLQPKIERLTKGLEKFYQLPNVGDIRQCGFIVGIELVKDKKTAEPYPYEARLGQRVMLRARKKGVVLRPLGDVIVLMPPLALNNRELDYLLKTAYQSIARPESIRGFTRLSR